MQCSQDLFTDQVIYSITQDEGGKETLEQKHPYENFDEKVGSITR